MARQPEANKQIIMFIQLMFIIIGLSRTCTMVKKLRLVDISTKPSNLSIILDGAMESTERKTRTSPVFLPSYPQRLPD